jgi:hypothetical protein
LDPYNTAVYAQMILERYLADNNLDAFLERVAPRIPALHDLRKPPAAVVPPTTAPVTARVTAPPTNSLPSQSAADIPATAAAIREYLNFDIIINPRQTDGSYSIRFVSPVGEERIQTTLTADEEDFTDRIYYLRELMGSEGDAETLGQQLNGFLFKPAAWTLFNRSLEKASGQNKAGLRIRLHIDLASPELNTIPWEYCRDDRSFMAVNTTTPLIRYIPTNLEAKTISVPDQVRLLLVTASPQDLDLLNVDQEVAHIQEALQDLVDEGRLQIQLISEASRRDLRKAVQTFDPHILHFVGHGMLNEEGQGMLALQGSSGKTQTTDAEDMLVLLRDRSTRLVILSACETGARSEAEAGARGLMGVAPKLVWGGMPAVLAMQFAASDDATIDFMETLYTELAQGEPLDTAVTEARVGLYFDYDDKTFWANPVLFMRAPDGVIW